MAQSSHRQGSPSSFAQPSVLTMPTAPLGRRSSARLPNAGPIQYGSPFYAAHYAGYPTLSRLPSTAGYWPDRDARWPAPAFIRGRTSYANRPPQRQFHQASSGLQEELPPPRSPPARGEGKRKPADAPKKREPIGQEPEDNTQVFLRGASVLLEPGMAQLDYGLSYSWRDFETIIVTPGGSPVIQNVRERQLVVPFTLRYGLTDRTEVFGLLPVGYAMFERRDILQDTSMSRGGLGDVGLGVKYLLHAAEEDRPDVVASASFTAPTGVSSFNNPGDVAALGSGFWTMSAGMTLIQSWDPVVVFGSLGYRHDFERRYFGAMFTPGETISYSLGLGLAVNEDVSLSAEVFGSYQGHLQVNGATIPNTTTEAASLRFSLTRRTSPTRFIEPFVSFGLTDDATDFEIGFFITKTIGKKQ